MLLVNGIGIDIIDNAKASCGEPFLGNQLTPDGLPSTPESPGTTCAEKIKRGLPWMAEHAHPHIPDLGDDNHNPALLVSFWDVPIEHYQGGGKCNPNNFF